MNIIQSIIRLMTFKITKDEILQFNRSHFITGLFGT
jgi:hypothetical protein